MPTSWHENAKDLMSRVNGKLRSYVGGVLLICALVFITQSIGFSLAGLSAPFLFALFCAVTDDTTEFEINLCKTLFGLGFYDTWLDMFFAQKVDAASFG